LQPAVLRRGGAWEGAECLAIGVGLRPLALLLLLPQLLLQLASHLRPKIRRTGGGIGGGNSSR